MNDGGGLGEKSIELSIELVTIEVINVLLKSFTPASFLDLTPHMVFVSISFLIKLLSPIYIPQYTVD